METNLVASDDREPSIRVILESALDGFSDNTLVEAIGNVISDRTGRELREGGFDVEFRHLDTLVALIEDRCRIGADSPPRYSSSATGISFAKLTIDIKLMEWEHFQHDKDANPSSRTAFIRN
ncbi:MAG: hypothetical protein H7Y36_03780 [Armatimonadetes bacterium]|nr:hypothetical protein [Akkermansiaceae bacterium]